MLCINTGAGALDTTETLFFPLVIGLVVMSSVLNLKHPLLMGYIICERT